jgi:hypothetical protein
MGYFFARRERLPLSGNGIGSHHFTQLLVGDHVVNSGIAIVGHVLPKAFGKKIPFPRGGSNGSRKDGWWRFHSSDVFRRMRFFRVDVWNGTFLPTYVADNTDVSRRRYDVISGLHMAH